MLRHPRRRSRAIASVLGTWLFAAALLAPLREAAAQSEVVGTVIAIDGDDLVIDLGSDRGLTDGAVVEIWRPLKLRHPVTGKVLTDRFKIGALHVGQIRKSLALARPSGDLERDPAAGDVVIWTTNDRPAAGAPRGAAIKAVEPAPSAPEASAPGPGSAAAAEVREIGVILDSLRGADLVTRIRRYEDYVRLRPQGRFARVLYEEAAALRSLVRGAAPGAEPRAVPAVVSWKAPEEVLSDGSVRFAIELDDLATGALLHVRKPGEVAYRSTPMVAVGGGYFAGAASASKTRDAELEYFIEATNAKGSATPLVGSSEQPSRVEVREGPKPPPRETRTASVAVLSDYADYNRLQGNDRVWQTEGYFGVRYGDVGVRAVRTGMGVYRGVGGTLEELDKRGLDGRKVGLTYGYLETEVGVVPAFALIGRAAVGLLDDGVSGGGQLLVRIGKDLETNLVLGGEMLGGIGLRSFAELDLNTFRRFPIVLRTEVTNQPAGVAASKAAPGVAQGTGEVGARGIAQVGFRVVQPLTVAVRGSFQGRTITHAGPGGGLAMGYEW